jgi:TRAP-type C4-dicarboxylate transport system substrate-binding protein
MRRNHSHRLALVAVGVVLGLAAAACTSGGADKAGGSNAKVVTLTLADVESDASSVQPYADAVKALSSGSLQIQIKLNWRRGDPQYEGDLIKDVEFGKVELGLSGTRAFDTVGIDSFQAMQAPFLIDSYGLEKQVLSSDIPAKMLEGMRPAGLVGLAVLPGDLRKPLGLTRALVSASDYRGARVGIRPGKVADATMRALGAIPVAYVPGDLSSLDGMEMHLGGIAGNHYDQNATELTGNVNFWPRNEAVFINTKAFDALSAQQREWLLQAGPRSLSQWPPCPSAMCDRGGGDTLCNRGLTIDSATTAEVAQLRRAVQPVYEDLERSPQTRAFIDQIIKMRDGTVDTPDAVSPCAGSSEPTKTTTVTALDGTWEVSITRKELLAAGIADAGEDDPSNYGHFTLTFHKGDYVQVNTTSNGSDSGTYISDSGTYIVDGNTLILKVTNGEVWTMTWSIYRDTLTLKGDIPAGLRAKPWRRVGP